MNGLPAANRLIDAFPGFAGIYTVHGDPVDTNERTASTRAPGAKAWDLPPWSASTDLGRQVREAMKRASHGDTVRIEARLAMGGIPLECDVTLTGRVFTRQAAAFLAECGRPQLDKPFSVEAVKQTVKAVAPGD